MEVDTLVSRRPAKWKDIIATGCEAWSSPTVSERQVIVSLYAAENAMARQPKPSNPVVAGSPTLRAHIWDGHMKRTYEKPTLRKCGKLTARTAQLVVSGVTQIE